MNSNDTDCPNCRSKKSVVEHANAFQCGECGNWGYSSADLPYRYDQPQDWHQDGQVSRKPRAA